MTKIFEKKILFLDTRKPLAKAARKPWISDYLLGESLGFRFEGLGFRV